LLFLFDPGSFRAEMVEAPKNPRIRKLLNELQQWCSQEWGRQAEVARVLGVFPQTVSAWFADQKQPTGEQALAILEFLKAQRRRRPPGPPAS
jgi:DNA-binding transcriptional regulator YiaG